MCQSCSENSRSRAHFSASVPGLNRGEGGNETGKGNMGERNPECLPGSRRSPAELQGSYCCYFITDLKSNSDSPAREDFCVGIISHTANVFNVFSKCCVCPQLFSEKPRGLAWNSTKTSRELMRFVLLPREKSLSPIF